MRTISSASYGSKRSSPTGITIGTHLGRNVMTTADIAAEFVVARQGHAALESTHQS
ncbi:MAG: hypothetical protein AW07_04670 [Candidatus Accumulibacter sp. SK-11]|nr:MAG: hypothetical protein AW07_04670 [Candidatus Accumulibacter sp. SK-11]